MLRLLWVVLALAVSAFAGTQWYVNGPLVVDWLNRFVFGDVPGAGMSDGVALALTGAAVVAASAAFVLIFVVLAVGDIVKHQALIAQLGHLRRAHGSEPVGELAMFLRVFRDDDELARLAADYGATLHAECLDPETQTTDRTHYRATVPAEAYFSRAALVDRALFAPVFQYVPRVLIGIGVVGLAAAVAGGTAGARASAGSGFSPAAVQTLLEGVQAGSAGLVLAVLAAVLAGLVYRVAMTARYHQTDRLCQEIDTLFRGPGAVEYLRELVRDRRAETARLAATLKAGTSDLTASMSSGAERVAAAVAESAEITSEAVSEAIKDALSRPMSKIAEVSRRQAKDQSAQVEKLLKATLPAFIGELEQHFGNQIKDINAVLQSSAAMATNLEATFTEIAEKLTRQAAEQVDSLSDAFRGSLEAISEREAEGRKELASDLRRLSQTLGEEVDSHSRQFEALLNNLLNRVEYLTETAVATSAADLAQTAESFTNLRTVVESLVVSVAPILNQIVDTQERLIKALEDEGAAGKIIARSAGDMSAAARASRETVERFIVLAERLSETRSALSADAGGRHRNAAAPAAAGTQPAADGLGQAIRDLRQAAEDSAKKLPKL